MWQVARFSDKDANRTRNLTREATTPGPSVEAQVTRCVGLENGQLVTKGENLGLPGGTGSKTGGEQSEKTDQY